LIAAQLVVEESAEQFAFRHALTRQAIEAELLVRERAALHRTIAEMIEQIYVGALAPHVVDLVYHSYEAGMWERALDYGRRAGERAQALGAPYTAIEQFTRALDAADKLAAMPDPTLYRARGNAFETIGDFNHARDDYERALRLVRDGGEGLAEWQCLIDLGQLWAGRDYEQAGTWFRSALDCAETPITNPPSPLLQAMHDGVRDGPDAVVRGVRALFGDITPHYEARLRALDYQAQAANLEYGQYHRPGLEDVLPTMTMPCLIYMAEEDDPGFTHVQSYVAQMPNAHFFGVPGNHVSANTNLTVIVPKVREFLAQIVVQFQCSPRAE